MDEAYDDNEAYNDFYGLPSLPRSIYHTGPAWPLPTGFEAYRIPKVARPVCDHEIAPMWRKLSERVYKYFDSVELKWTSIDPVRFAEVAEYSRTSVTEPGPLFLWVGVLPGTLSRSAARAAAQRCKEILSEDGILDVEVAFRESVFTPSVGPQPLNHAKPSDPMFDIRSPFTPALGLQIASKAFPYFEGAGCLYICEGGDSDRIFLLTARHVVLPPSKYCNDPYNREIKGTPRRDIIHLGSRAFQNSLEAIMDKIRRQDITISLRKDWIEQLGEAVEGEETRREEYEESIAAAKETKARVYEFKGEITDSWCLESHRILGHILYAPPISVSTDDTQLIEDWALIELNRDKFDWDSFRGNVVRLGGKLTPREFMRKMYPDSETRANFECPHDGLVQLRDFVKDGELRQPTLLDEDGEDCIIVVKNGPATGATLGRASGLESLVREYKDSAIHSTFTAIAIYSYAFEDYEFSAPGDSGAVVADAHRRIVGMIIGGAGKADLNDVTYVSPYYFLDQRIKEVFPNSYLYPIPDLIAL